MVEYVRSCYRSLWRLFQNRPDVLTAGRYYFAPEGTPHYEGIHHYGSADWTWDATFPPVPPVLGEVKRLPRPYSLGSLGVSHPPAAVLADPACLRLGETYPQVIDPQRRLIMGVDSRCWTMRGVVPPLGPPTLPLVWVRSDELDGLAEGAPIAAWPQAPAVGGFLVQSDPDKRPVADTLTLPGKTVGLFLTGQEMALSKPLAPTVDFTAAVAFRRNGPFGIGQPGPAGKSAVVEEGHMFDWGTNFLTYRDAAQFRQWGFGTFIQPTVIFWVRRKVNVLALGARGRGEVELAVDPSSTVDLVSVGFSAVPSSPGIPVKLYEVLVWNRWLDDAEVAQLSNDLWTKYGV